MDGDRDSRWSPLGPGGRPAGGLRPIVTILALVAAVPGVFVMFSDRAPGWLERLTNLIQRLDSRPGDAVRATGVDDPDVAVHLAIWAAAGFLIVLMAWSWRSLAVGVGAAFLAGVAVEAAQQRYTATRAAEWNDILGNTIGLGAGTTVGLLVWAAMRLLMNYRGVASLVRPEDAPEHSRHGGGVA